MATLAKYIAKYLHPVIKTDGFVKSANFWQKTVGDWRTIVAFESFKAGPLRWYLRIELGVFSLPVERIFGHHLVLNCPISDMPGGIPACHFYGRLEDFDENLNFLSSGENTYIPLDADMANIFPQIAERLERLLPRFESKYKDLAIVADRAKHKIGYGYDDAVSQLNAAAACVLLKRYTEVEERVSSALKKNNSKVALDGAGRILSELNLRRKRENVEITPTRAPGH